MSTVKVVYVEWCDLEGGAPGATLRIVNEDGSLGRELVFARKALSGSVIGGVYEVEQTGPTSYVLTKRQYRGQYQDKAMVAQWQTANRAAQLTIESARMEKKDKDLPAALELMEPLREMYKKALPNRKRAIEIVLLNYLRQ